MYIRAREYTCARERAGVYTVYTHGVGRRRVTTVREIICKCIRSRSARRYQLRHYPRDLIRGGIRAAASAGMRRDNRTNDSVIGIVESTRNRVVMLLFSGAGVLQRAQLRSRVRQRL